MPLRAHPTAIEPCLKRRFAGEPLPALACVGELRGARDALEPLGTRPFLDEIDALLAGVAAPA
jgi:hypothetical protein